MSNKWIKKGDKVIVLAGNEKGKMGSVVFRKPESVVIQGVNIRKKHAKAKTQGAQSGILEIEAPIHISNVSICTDEGKAIKLKVKQNKDGNKELVYTLGSKEIVYRQIKTNKK